MTYSMILAYDAISDSLSLKLEGSNKILLMCFRKKIENVLIVFRCDLKHSLKTSVVIQMITRTTIGGYKSRCQQSSRCDYIQQQHSGRLNYKMISSDGAGYWHGVTILVFSARGDKAVCQHTVTTCGASLVAFLPSKRSVVIELFVIIE